MRAFGERIWHAQGSVVVLFTATPVVDEPIEAVHMLHLIQGKALAGQGDEGFVSWFMERPVELFARATPSPNRLPRILWVPIDGSPVDNIDVDVDVDDDNPRPRKRTGAGGATTTTKLFDVYRKRRFGGGRRSRSNGVDASHRCLDRPHRGAACEAPWAYLESLAYFWVHERNHFPRLASAEDARQLCPKLAHMAESVAADDRKTVILIHRENGYRTLVHLLAQFGVSLVQTEPLSGKQGAALRQAHRTNQQRREDFNDRRTNVRGEVARVFVAPAEEFSEGVSFRNVRRIILADLSPGLTRPSWSMVKQRVARALRTCSHSDLSPAERDLQIDLFVAVHNQAGLPPTLDEEKLEIVRADKRAVEEGMDFLRERSLDAAYFAGDAGDFADARLVPDDWARRLFDNDIGTTT